jgi:glucose-6-phosphate isomerase
MKNIIKNKKNICYFTSSLLNLLKKKAINSKIKRSRILMHISNKSKVHEMIIALMKNSYVPPHQHPKHKSESYFIIQGTMDLNIFNNKGKQIRKISMGDYKSKKPFYYRMSQGGHWHMPVATSKFCIYHETFSGPFEKKYDVKFPKWEKPR